MDQNNDFTGSPPGKIPAGAGALERGVTLVEVLIVVAIIAMVASGVAVFALPKFKEAQIKTAETGARVIRGAVQNWQRVNNESTCPTMSQLVQEKELDSATTTTDPWGEAYIALVHRRRRHRRFKWPRQKKRDAR